MSAHTLLNLLNELVKSDKVRGFQLENINLAYEKMMYKPEAKVISFKDISSLSAGELSVQPS